MRPIVKASEVICDALVARKISSAQADEWLVGMALGVLNPEDVLVELKERGLLKK